MAKSAVIKASSMSVEDESVVEVVSKKETFYPKFDTNGKDILESVYKGMSIKWDFESLPELEKETVNKLPYAVVQDYLKAKKKRDERPDGIEVLGMLGSSADKKLKIRERRGWHQTWKRPDQFDESIEIGYKVVREPKKDSNGNFVEEKPGEESGEVKKIGYKDKPELIAMEIPMERKIAHNIAVSKRSKRAYSANKDGFRSAVEEVNSSIKDRDDRIVIVDDDR